MKIKPLGFAMVVLFFLSSCTADVNGMPEPRSSSESRIEEGRRLIADFGCGSCHFIPGIPGADSTAAPPLDRFYQRTYIQNPQQIDPGNAMPDLGVTQEEARDIAAYLYDYHPPTLGDLFRR
jgi:mono/diheme cytochrome c family protein